MTHDAGSRISRSDAVGKAVRPQVIEVVVLLRRELWLLLHRDLSFKNVKRKWLFYTSRLFAAFS